ncbi:hypothetical protein HHK36_021656 [Tetracentron sinense]|uniref:CRM domain-containing protein n=1 Tax=Tetracentron sinense TaxID=13715 RepID=A0A834YXC9_TETSI|nr:hypothetical protein HHK36_021656 [Tetracentron sinense]
MALKTVVPFTIFAPKTPSHRPGGEVRFSRWNNANAEKFIRHERAQKEIEDEIRRERRYESASKIADSYDKATNADNESFKSIGTPSSPSRSSIPGKSSKYSKNPNPNLSHPAFRRTARVSKISGVPPEAASGVSIGENGVLYRIPNAPFEFQYSYTETPKVKPLALREPPFVPFGPSTMPRPWTGRAPLPPSKKKLPVFDSFRLPPPHKKGVKPVQSPGPFLAGSGPKYVKSREEILGEPLTKEEIKDLVQGCLRSRRQLNMGRDGLTHNMLDNIHAHWKRRRVCKIKCKGVCTVDMDNVRQQLEEKTGGKIIYSKGGALFLFRGRNYNYRTRPRFPLMLWKPVTPVYPRLIQRAPEGLTLEEASEMRKRGRKLPPICKLGKNGVYSDLVELVKEAFEECELVRINCQGMNGSDYKKIGAKIKDLVQCVLVSFENEHILMWRGRDAKFSLPNPEGDCKEGKESETDDATFIPPNYVDSSLVEGQETSELCAPKISIKNVRHEIPNTSISSLGDEDFGVEETEDLPLPKRNDQPSAANTYGCATIQENMATSTSLFLSAMNMNRSDTTPDSTKITDNQSKALSMGIEDLGLVPTLHGTETHDKLLDVSEDSQHVSNLTRSSATCTEGVVLLLKQAIENGSAAVLDDAPLDANIVYERVVALAKVSPPGPVFKRRLKKVLVQKCEKQEREDLEVEEVVTVSENRGIEKKSSRNQRTKNFKDFSDIVPHGSLRVDELAKLLA